MTVTTDRAVQGVVLLNLLEERIRDLWRYRAWYRRQRNSAHWSPLRIANDAELRMLVGHLRRARALAMPVVERLDPMTAAGDDDLPERRDRWNHIADDREADAWAGDHHVYPAGVGR